MSPVDDPERGEGFLSRWSRRKRAVPDEPAGGRAEPDDKAASLAGQTVGEGSAIATGTALAVEPEDEIDLSLLPDIDTLTAESDIAAFLRKGVPDALKNAALRKIWVSDPGIRDFIGPVDYQWDFNTPNFMHGFGEIEPGMDVQHMVRNIFGDAHPVPDSLAPVEPVPDLPASPSDLVAMAGSEPAADPAGEAQVEGALEQGGADSPPAPALFLAPEMDIRPDDGDLDGISASESEDEIYPPLPRRRHGGALPL